MSRPGEIRPEGAPLSPPDQGTFVGEKKATNLAQAIIERGIGKSENLTRTEQFRLVKKEAGKWTAFRAGTAAVFRYVFSFAFEEKKLELTEVEARNFLAAIKTKDRQSPEVQALVERVFTLQKADSAVMLGLQWRALQPPIESKMEQAKALLAKIEHSLKLYKELLGSGPETKKLLELRSALEQAYAATHPEFVIERVLTNPKEFIEENYSPETIEYNPYFTGYWKDSFVSAERSLKQSSPELQFLNQQLHETNQAIDDFNKDIADRESKVQKEIAKLTEERELRDKQMTMFDPEFVKDYRGVPTTEYLFAKQRFGEIETRLKELAKNLRELDEEKKLKGKQLDDKARGLENSIQALYKQPKNQLNISNFVKMYVYNEALTRSQQHRSRPFSEIVHQLIMDLDFKEGLRRRLSSERIEIERMTPTLDTLLNSL